MRFSLTVASSFVLAFGFYCFLCSAFEQVDDWIVAKTFYGDLRGKRLTSSTGIPYFSFRGVSYAYTPSGELRFKIAFPPKHWHLYKDAVNDSKLCIQNPPYPIKLKDVEAGKDQESEDCLYMNILVPAAMNPPEHGYPVLYMVHDGWFNYGGMSDFNVEQLVDKFVANNIVVITVQYRLGILGFISTGDKQGMGNWGLWDIVQGLKYVKETGEKFGMDAGNVTVFGYGSGAAAVSLLNYMHEAEIYFNRTIAHSGSAFSFWAASEERPVLLSEGISEEVDCGEFDSKRKKDEALECLRKMTIKQIQKSQMNIEKFLDNLDEVVPELLYAAPRLDEILIPHSLPMMLEKLPSKPMLIGVSQGEMNRYIVRGKNFDVARGFERLLVKEPSKFDVSAFETKLRKCFSTDLWPRAANRAAGIARDIYLSSSVLAEPLNTTVLLQTYSQLVTDLWINAGAFEEATVRAQQNPLVWLYDLDFSGVFNSAKDFTKSIDLLGLLNLRKEEKRKPSVFVDIPKSLSDALFKSYVSFIKTGNPNEQSMSGSFEWPAFTAERPFHLKFSLPSETPVLLSEFYSSRMDFWTKRLPELETELGGGRKQRKTVNISIAVFPAGAEEKSGTIPFSDMRVDISEDASTDTEQSTRERHANHEL